MSIRDTKLSQSKWLLLGAALALCLLSGFVAVNYPILAWAAIALIVGCLIAVIWGNGLTRRRLISTLLVSSILFPGINIPGLWQVRPEDLIALALLPAALSSIRWKLTKIDVIFLLIALSTVLSMGWGVFLGVPFNLRDTMELIKLVKYWLFFHLALYPWSEDDLKRLITWIAMAIGLAALIGLLQQFDWLGLGTWTRRLYVQGTLHELVSRVTGTMRNPNDFAFLLITSFALILNSLPSLRAKPLLLGVLLLELLAIVGTTSRSGVLSIGLIVVVSLSVRTLWWRGVPERRWLKRVGFAATAGIIILSIGVPLIASEFRAIERMSDEQRLAYTVKSEAHALVYRMSQTFSSQSGLTERAENWQANWAIFAQSPILGWGPGKSIHGAIVDSEYLLVLRRYGIFGLGSLLLLYGQAMLSGLLLLRLYPHNTLRWQIGLGLTGIVLSYLMINIVASIFYDLQLMSFFWLLVGLAYSCRLFQTKAISPQPGG